MDYEKKYKEALELARVAAFNGHQSLMEGIFPELKESEDEKTRKRIIALVNAHGQGMYKDDMLAWLKNIPYTIDHEKREGFHLGYKAGLEKQGEQKPTLRERYKNIANSEWFKKTYEGMSISDDEEVDNVNNIEPKFKVGDKVIGVVSDMQYYITDVCYDHYYTESGCIIMFCSQDNFKLVEQKSAWSEETDDDAWMNDIISKVENNLQLNKAEIDWLKNLKQRIGGEQ